MRLRLGVSNFQVYFGYDGKICEGNLAFHLWTLPGVGIAGVPLACLVRGGGWGAQLTTAAIAVYYPVSGTGTREKKQYCPEGKVCASNLTSHVRTLPEVEA